MDIRNLILSFVWIYYQYFSIVLSSALPDTIIIGGLFEDRNKGVEIAFRHTTEKINLRGDVLGKSLLIYNIASVAQDDSFESSKKVCKMIKDGVAAIFGPSSQISSGHVQSICNTLSIPHIQTHWDARVDRDYFSISLYPHYEVLGKAYVDLIKYWQWNTFTILYEDNDGLIRLEEVLKFSKGANVKVTVRKLDDDPTNWVYMFKEMIDKQEKRMIIDCDVKKVEGVLHKASLVSIVNEYYHFMFTTLDLGLLDLDQYSFGGANITAFRLVDPKNPKVVAVNEDWVFEELNNRESPLQGQRMIPTDVALMYDGVFLAAHALDEVGKAKQISTDKELSCSKSKSWADGLSVLNYMKTMDFQSLTGRVQFENGERRNFNLDVVELTRTGLQKIGTWGPKPGVNITKSEKERKVEVEKDLSKKVLRITTKEDPPYVMRPEGEVKPGAPKFEGFVIDVLELLKNKLKFNYTIEAADGYGSCKEDKRTKKIKCDGMMKDLVEGKADLAVAGMTITYDREKYIDFTKPFINLGISILFKKPEPAPPKLFSFLDPLSTDVWIYLLAAFMCVSFMLFVIARFTPYEWCNPHPCNPETDVVENQFSILNSLWFSIGALMQQGSEVAPRAISTRLVACCWWFFTLIIISSYTANLAAFLTVERMVSPIEGAEDLAKQSVIKYGTQRTGSTAKFFSDSVFPTFQQMWTTMDSDPDNFVGSNVEGMGKVETGNYAYFAESTYIEYVIARKCELMQIGGLLDSKGYGIGLPVGSPYRDAISDEILNLQEQQKIAELKVKWWQKERVQGGVCAEVKKSTTKALSIKNVGGVFVVLAGGVIGGFFISMCEFVWKARKNAKEDKQTLCSEMSEEFRFALTCYGSTKPTNRKSSLEITDNGVIQTAPMLSNNYGGSKEYYA
ncbi:glutamate receptor ionotropic, kainate 2-like [Mytilus trossulus]|uniref:glutamate receptor ionotropic, kainate 2-like n=1 Tax=Mytilus trossulus TaxID=6551 RepID=UPI003004C62B